MAGFAVMGEWLGGRVGVRVRERERERERGGIWSWVGGWGAGGENVSPLVLELMKHAHTQVHTHTLTHRHTSIHHGPLYI